MDGWFWLWLFGYISGFLAAWLVIKMRAIDYKKRWKDLSEQFYEFGPEYDRAISENKGLKRENEYLKGRLERRDDAKHRYVIRS